MRIAFVSNVVHPFVTGGAQKRIHEIGARLARPLHRRLAANDHDLVVAPIFPYFPVLASKLAAFGTDTPLVTRNKRKPTNSVMGLSATS